MTGPPEADTCPPDADLSGFLDETLPPDRQASVGDHVDGCAGCQARLEALDADAGGVVDRYHRLAATPPSAFLPLPLPLPAPGRLTQRLHGPPTPPPSSGGLFDHLPTVPGFEVLSEIGRGGMGVVFKARHKQLNRLCALKVVIAGGAADARTVQRFLFEAEVLARVQHPQVVQVYDVGTYRGAAGIPIPYLAMELLEGGTLAAFAGRRPQPPRTAAALVEGVARAVHAVHLQGVIHRDLKPGNILFANADSRASAANGKGKPGRPTGHSGVLDPRAVIPKVSDFGLAKFTEGAAELTASGLIVGTPGYMAPEQAGGGKAVGPAADVYALGAILYELLTGNPPFDGREPMSVLVRVMSGNPPDVRAARPDCPKDLAAVVMRCLAKDPAARYPTAQALADDLASYLANRPTAARPPHPLVQLWMAVARNRVVAALVFALLVAVGVGLGNGLTYWAHTAQIAIAADRAHREAQEAAFRLGFDQSVRLCEDGQPDRGLEGLLGCMPRVRWLRDPEAAEAVLRRNLAAWPAGLARPPGRLAHDGAVVRAVAYTPAGDRAVTVGGMATAAVWDAGTGCRVRWLPVDPWRVRLPTPWPTFWCVAVNPAGTRAAAGGSDGQVWVWDLTGGGCVAAWAVCRADVWAVAFAPDGSLWTGDSDDRVRRWEADTGRPLGGLGKPTPGGAVQCLAVTADGGRLVAGDRHGTVTEWDTGTAAVVRTYAGPDRRCWVADVALSADGRLAAAATDGRVRVWDRAGGRPPAEYDLGGAHGSGVAFGPGGRLLAGDNDGTVRMWAAAAGDQPRIPLRAAGPARPVRFRPGTDVLAVPAGDAVEVWRLPPAAGRPLPPPDPADREPVRGLDFDPTGGRLLVARRHLTVYRPADGGVERTYPVQTPSLSARYDPARPRLLRTDRRGWWAVDLATGAETRGAGPTDGYVTAVEPAPDGRTALTADASRLLEWDAADLRPAGRHPASDRLGKATPARAVRLRPDGRELLLAAGGRLEFCDPATGQPTRDPIPAGDQVLDARWTPDGRRVAAGLRSGAAGVWDRETGKPVGGPFGHPLPVTCVAVAPDGRTVLTGSRDGTARFWDADTGLPVGPPLRHPDAVVAVAYSPDGRRVATGTVGGRATVWDVPPPPAAGSPDELRAGLAEFGVPPE